MSGSRPMIGGRADRGLPQCMSKPMTTYIGTATSRVDG